MLGIIAANSITAPLNNKALVKLIRAHAKFLACIQTMDVEVYQPGTDSCFNLYHIVLNISSNFATQDVCVVSHQRTDLHCQL